MALGDDADELRFGVGDVGERLPGHRLGIEDDEVDRMAGAQRDADFRVFLEAADARAVARARIDDDERALGVVDLDAARRNDAHQRVVRRPLVAARVGDELVLVVQHRRLAGGLVLEPLVAALAQRVPEQHRALRGVDLVLAPTAAQTRTASSGPRRPPCTPPARARTRPA